MYTVVRENNVFDVYFSINLQLTKQFKKPVPEGVEPKQGATTITDYHIQDPVVPPEFQLQLQLQQLQLQFWNIYLEQMILYCLFGWLEGQGCTLHNLKIYYQLELQLQLQFITSKIQWSSVGRIYGYSNIFEYI